MMIISDGDRDVGGCGRDDQWWSATMMVKMAVIW